MTTKNSNRRQGLSPGLGKLFDYQLYCLSRSQNILKVKVWGVGISSYCFLEPTLVLSSQPAHPLPGAWKTQPANWWPQHPACSQRACSGPWEDQGVDRGAGLVISTSFSYWLQLFLAPVSSLGAWIQGLKDFGRAKLNSKQWTRGWL